MGGRRARLALLVVAVLGATLFTAGGSAGNRTAEVTFQVFPGQSVSVGAKFATKTSFRNTGKSNFTHVEVRQRVPAPAILVDSSCGAVVVGNEVRCDFGSLGSGATATATFVWRAPAGVAPCTNCLTTDGSWIIKEGKPTNQNETFVFPEGAPFSASLLGGDGSSETQKAGSYETAGTTGPCLASVGSLRTNQSLTSSNPVSTTVCLPPFAIPQGSFDLGLASTIVESATHQHAGGHPELGQSEVCIAAPGQSCGGTYTPQNFAPQTATFIFRISNSALTTVSTLSIKHGGPPPPPPSSKKITQVFHNTVLLPKCSDDPNFADGCLVSITQDKLTKIWTVTARASTNGSWDW